MTKKKTINIHENVLLNPNMFGLFLGLIFCSEKSINICDRQKILGLL